MRSARARRQDQIFGMLGQRQPIEHGLQPAAVVVRVSNQHGSQQARAIFGNDQLLIDLATFVDE